MLLTRRGSYSFSYVSLLCLAPAIEEVGRPQGYAPISSVDRCVRRRIPFFLFFPCPSSLSVAETWLDSVRFDLSMPLGIDLKRREKSVARGEQILPWEVFFHGDPSFFPRDMAQQMSRPATFVVQLAAIGSRFSGSALTCEPVNHRSRCRRFYVNSFEGAPATTIVRVDLFSIFQR